MVTWTNHNRAVCLIPTRMDSSRFPGKPLVDLGGKPLIQRCYESARVLACKPQIRTKLCLKEIFLVVDNEAPYRKTGLPMICPGGTFHNGTDRVAEAARLLVLPDDEIILNIQGDNPNIHPGIIMYLLDAFDDPDVNMATVATRNHSGDIRDRNTVKVFVDNAGFAKTFSRELQAWPEEKPDVLEHIGIYAYRNHFLQHISRMPQSEREVSEDLEQLRVLDYGFDIKVVETSHACKSINVPADLEHFKGAA